MGPSRAAYGLDLGAHVVIVGQRSACFADAPDQSVSKPPGSISVTCTPNEATSCASACEKPSSAHFEAWVDAEQRECRDAADRGHLEDVAAALRPQIRQCGLGDPQGTEDVGLDLIACVLLGQLLDEAELTVAGVVTTISSRPKWSCACLTAAKSASRSVTSNRMGSRASPYFSVRSSSEAVLRAVAATLSPRSSAAIAHARQIHAMYRG